MKPDQSGQPYIPSPDKTSFDFFHASRVTIKLLEARPLEAPPPPKKRVKRQNLTILESICTKFVNFCFDSQFEHNY